MVKLARQIDMKKCPTCGEYFADYKLSEHSKTHQTQELSEKPATENKSDNTNTDGDKK